MKKKVSKKKIYVSGHTGMVGSAIVRFLKKDNNNIEIITKKRNQLNLLNQAEVLKFFQKKNIDEVYLAAANVGGIYANDTYPAEFIYENLMIQTNIIHSAFLSGGEHENAYTTGGGSGGANGAAIRKVSGINFTLVGSPTITGATDQIGVS